MKKPVTSKNYLLALNIITWAQMITLMVFSGIILFLKNTEQISGNENLINTFQYVIPLAVIVSLSSAHLVFKTITGKLKDSDSLKEKLKKFQGAYIMRAAIMELSGLLGAVAAFLTGELYFLSAALLIIVVLYIQKASIFSISEDLKLTSVERDHLSNPRSVVSEI